MNCPNCAAPMTLIPRRDYFRCDYCTTLHFPQPPADSPDRVTSLAAVAPVDCPICFAPLLAGAVDGARVMFCDTCRGILGNAVIDSCGRCRLIWLDHGELAHIERASGRR